MEGYQHTAVLLEPLLEYLNPRVGGTYVDANLGGGTHSQGILDRIGSDGRLLGIDLDAAARQAASQRLRQYSNFEAVAGNFADLEALLAVRNIEAIDGIIFDLGVSSPQLDRSERGFSFKGGGPLDMRFDPGSGGQTAADLVNSASEQELATIIKDYGEEKWAAKIARDIVSMRTQQPLTTTDQLALLIERSIPRKFHPPRIHPATRTFQALRIAVNRELDNLQAALEASPTCLRGGGRLCVISYHSLEDRIVKQTLLRHSGVDPNPPHGLPRGLPPPPGPPADMRILTRQPIVPTPAELESNPRARSARLRAAEKT